MAACRMPLMTIDVYVDGHTDVDFYVHKQLHPFIHVFNAFALETFF
jgi:hypothetical protein